MIVDASVKVEEPSPHDKELTALWELEKQQRKAIDFATQPPSDRVLGSDPYRIARVGKRLVGLLRGDSAVVLLDDQAKELARIEGPRGVTALAVLGDDVLVVGREGGLVQLHVEGDQLERVATLPIDGLIDARGLALAPDGKTAYVVEERQGRLLAVSLARDGKAWKATATRELGRCHGPIAVKAVADLIVTNCLLDRAIEIRRGTSVQRIQHDGPLWGFDVVRTRAGDTLLAATGVEDHPLVREDGGFGYIDSFLFLYKLGAKPERLAAVNLGEHGGVTPKWLELHDDGDSIAVETAGFGSGQYIIASWPKRAFDRAPTINRWPLPPGIVDAAQPSARVFASSLFDSWVVMGGLGEPPRMVPAGKPDARTPVERLGELLFFTEMMAPWGKTDGKLSRFTCETCHHEGYTDGRTHFTGREVGFGTQSRESKKVHATTRPLLGLFNNAPYFSRALDQTMTQMVHSEFKVANRHNGRDPWFSLTDLDIEWWSYTGRDKLARLAPEVLREGLLRFLIQFTHRANAAAAHAAFTPVEQRGAEVFRDRCASCHAARLIAEEPTTEVPFDRWERLVLSESGPLVWNTAQYAKTGVEPYVHDEGTRIPTLRRLYKKFPYFTNGSAKSLAELLDRYAYDTTGHHDQTTAAMTKLTADEKIALLAFLNLL